MKNLTFIAICGAPNSGKSTVAEYIVQKYQAYIVDDGMPLREGVLSIYHPLGIKASDVFTQEGKDRSVDILEKLTTPRELLGELGNHLERLHGEQFIPEIAISAALKHHKISGKNIFCFPSVRKTQGLTYSNHGAIIIEMVRNGCKIVNDFDFYDQQYVTDTIVNNGSLEDLKVSVSRIFDSKIGGF